MLHVTYGHFVWTDLSTYDLAAAKVDYAGVFGWRFQGGGGYDFATLDGTAVAAVFLMPSRLAEMQMPSFWMSYVRVDDLESMVAKARSHPGVIIEVEPQAFDSDARISLVRDPSGAGFTLYEGPDIEPPTDGVGKVVMRYHHGPDVGLIEPFYSDLFGWTFTKVSDAPWPVYDIRHPDGPVIAQAEEVPETIRGKYRYWMPSFSVPSREGVLSKIGDAGGQIVSELSGGRTLVADRQGAHFIIQAPDGAYRDDSVPSRPTPTTRTSPIPWKATLGLCCIWLAVFLDLQAFWGLLLLIWTWPAIKTGRADFIEPVSRRTQPIAFWALVSTWIVLSVWLIFAPFVSDG